MNLSNPLTQFTNTSTVQTIFFFNFFIGILSDFSLEPHCPASSFLASDKIQSEIIFSQTLLVNLIHNSHNSPLLNTGRQSKDI